MNNQCKKHPFADMVSVDCHTCGGSGEKEWDDDACSSQEMITCWRCNGSGESPFLECLWCLDDLEAGEKREKREK